MIVEISARARAELASAVAYLETENPQAAEKISVAIGRAIDTLADMPRRGRSGRVAGTRELVVKGAPYILIYAAADAGVFVLSIRHKSRGWSR